MTCLALIGTFTKYPRLITNRPPKFTAKSTPLPLATSLPARCLLLHLQSSQPQGSSHTLSRGKWINILILDDGCCWQQEAVDSSNSPACPACPSWSFLFLPTRSSSPLFCSLLKLKGYSTWLSPLLFVTALLFYSAFVCTDPVSSNCNYPFPSTIYFTC